MRLAIPGWIGPSSTEGRFLLFTRGVSVFWSPGSYPPCQGAGLPSEGLKFALNAASDSLPHNSNLSIWRRREGLTDGCKLCGRKQTLLHILNDCPVALELKRYNQHHDSVLNEIVGFIKPRLPPGANIIADLPSPMYVLIPSPACCN